MTRPRHIAGILVAALGLTLAGCAASDDDATATDTTATDTSTLPQGWVRVAGDDVAQVDEPGRQQLPATITGDDDVLSTVTDTSRTIAGGDDIIEIFDALGLSDNIFAAPEESATDTGQQAQETFLFNASTGTEGVHSLNGTVFVGNSVRRHSDLAAELRDTGLDAVVIDNLGAAPDKIRLTASALGLPDAGLDLAAQVEQQYAEAARIAASTGKSPRVLHISATGAGGNPAVGGANTAAAGVIAAAGATNVGTEADVADYSPLSAEGVVQTSPDVILLSENDLRTWGGAEGVLAAFPSLSQTPAGEAQRFVVMPDLHLKTGSVSSGAGAIALAEYFSTL